MKNGLLSFITSKEHLVRIEVTTVVTERQVYVYNVKSRATFT